MKLSRRLFLIAALSAVLALGACGDGDDDGGGGNTGSSEQSEQAPAGPTTATVDVSETEYKISPSTITVKKAGAVEFKVENQGQETHALEVEGGDVEEETEDIAPGESATLKVELTDGDYELYCPIDGHKDKGMTAELKVGAGGGGAGSADDSSEDDSSTQDEDDSGY